MADPSNADTAQRPGNGASTRGTWIAFVLSLAAAAYTCVAPGPAILLGPVIGLPSALFALDSAYAAWKQRRAHRDRAVPVAHTASVRGAAQLAAALALVLAHLLLGLGVLGTFREVAKSAVSASNLRGIWMGMKMYYSPNGDYAGSLAGLVTADLCSPGHLLALHDPDRYEAGPGEPLYSSYVYQPGAGACSEDARLILAFERAPWTRGELRLFCERGRFVLFADGNVRWLRPGDFASARRTDRAARAGLGWPPAAEPDRRERKTD